MTTLNSIEAPENLAFQLSFKLRAAHLAVQRQLVTALGELSLSPEEFYVMHALRKEGLPQMLIAAQLGINAPNLSRLTSRLLADGLVARTALPIGRRFILELTEQGRTKEQAALTLFFNHAARVDRQVGAKRAEAVAALELIAKLPTEMVANSGDRSSAPLSGRSSE